MTRLLWSVSIFTLLFQLSHIGLPQFFIKKCYLAVCEEEDSQVFEPDPQFLNFDPGSGSRSETGTESKTDFIHTGRRDLKGLASIHPGKTQNSPKATMEQSSSTDGPAWDSSNMDISKCLHIAQEHLDNYTRMIISSISKEWQPKPTFSGLPWYTVVIIVLIDIIIFFTFLWRTMHAVNTTLSSLKGENDQQERKYQQLEEQVKMLKQDREALNNEKWQLKEHVKLLQQILHLNELCQDNSNTGQQKLDSEHHESETQMKEALRIQKHKMQEMERQHLKTEALLNTKIALEEKRVQENWINTCVAERALEAERKETASLREQLMEALTKLAHIRSPVFLPATVSFDQEMTNLSKGGSAMQTSSGSALDESEITTFFSVSGEVDRYKEKLQASENMVQQLEEHIQKLECDKASLHSEKQYMDNLIAIMQEKLAIMDDLCQQKDKALQEKLAQEQLEQHEKDIRAAGPKEEIRAFKQRIQEIEGKHHKTEADLKSKIEFHKKQAEQNRISALVSERALLLERRETESLRKKLVEVSAKLAGYQGLLSEPTASCSAQQIPPARKGVPKKSDLDELTNSTPEALDKERSSFMKKLLAEECELQQPQDKNSTNTLEQERATSKDKCHLKMQIKSLQHKLNKMKEMFQ
ncbi:hypothetical protein MATL_G00226670 [Megalops atlanticus]|uniref:Nuclear pore complex interacting protein N-terminal domain-containing protein n=1 Tax=Megalops atlanticus TaxID=7932 RepID=A0A9D3PFI3_MEGAT|nr:hypothetical protein MATL_G00226670 [Megalops atlanticus]